MLGASVRHGFLMTLFWCRYLSEKRAGQPRSIAGRGNGGGGGRHGKRDDVMSSVSTPPYTAEIAIILMKNPYFQELETKSLKAGTIWSKAEQSWNICEQGCIGVGGSRGKKMSAIKF